MEVPPRFELGNKGFADLCLTTWRWYRISAYTEFFWSGRRGLRTRDCSENATFWLVSLSQNFAFRQIFFAPKKLKNFSGTRFGKCRNDIANLRIYLERKTGFGPATFALARQRSTTEPLPRVKLFLLYGISNSLTPCQGKWNKANMKLLELDLVFSLPFPEGKATLYH